jgi:hypothetical protein
MMVMRSSEAAALVICCFVAATLLMALTLRRTTCESAAGEGLNWRHSAKAGSVFCAFWCWYYQGWPDSGQVDGRRGCWLLCAQALESVPEHYSS